MPFAYINQDQPIEIPAEGSFSTAQLIIAEDEADLYGVPAGEIVDHRVTHPPNALEVYGPDDFARYRILRFEYLTPPSGKVVVTRTLVLVDDAVAVSETYQDAPAPPVPDSVSRLRALLELAAQPSPGGGGRTLLDDVDAGVAGQSDRSIQIYWANASDFQRAHPKLIAMADLLGWSSTQIDALFVAAAIQA